MKAIRKKLMVVALALSSVTPAHAGIEEIIGGIIGGGLSAFFCRELGGSRDVQIACSIGGAVLGSKVARDMSEADARAYADRQREAFDGEIDRDYRWEGRDYGSNTDIHGRIRPVGRGYHRVTHEECRTFKSITYRGNRAYEEEKTSIVCRRSNGTFYNLEQKDVYVNGRLVESNRSEREGRVNPPRYDERDRDYDRRDRDYDRRDRDYDRNDRRPLPPPPPVPVCEGWSLRYVTVGQYVYDARGYQVQFRGFNPDSGTVLVYDVAGRAVRLNASDIAVPGCQYGLRSGDYVSTRYGNGRIAGVYQNGDVVVRVGDRAYRLQSRDIYR